MAITSCNLKSCFDRVVHAPAILAMASVGIPDKHMYSMFHTIQNINFTTRTAFGDSDETFGGLKEGFVAKPLTLKRYYDRAFHLHLIELFENRIGPKHRYILIPI